MHGQPIIFCHIDMLFHLLLHNIIILTNYPSTFVYYLLFSKWDFVLTSRNNGLAKTRSAGPVALAVPFVHDPTKKGITLSCLQTMYVKWLTNSGSYSAQTSALGIYCSLALFLTGAPTNKRLKCILYSYMCSMHFCNARKAITMQLWNDGNDGEDVDMTTMGMTSLTCVIQLASQSY